MLARLSVQCGTRCTIVIPVLLRTYLVTPLTHLVIVAHGIKFPDQGSDPGPLLWQCRSLYHWEVPNHVFFGLFFKVCVCILTNLCPTLCDSMDCTWNGLPFPSPDFLDPGTEPLSPSSPASQADSLPTEPVTIDRIKEVKGKLLSRVQLFMTP